MGKMPRFFAVSIIIEEWGYETGFFEGFRNTGTDFKILLMKDCVPIDV